MAATLVFGGALAVTMTCAAAGPGRADPSPDPLPEAADVVSAFLTVRQWVDEFTLPDTADPAARLPLRDASGVCVILRRSGQVKGLGFDSTGDDLMVRRAIGRAMSDVLGDRAVANLPEPLMNEAGRVLTLELEVAGRPIPLLGKTYRDVAAQLTPGLDGVAVRRAQTLAMLFPAQMRATNTADRVEHLLLPLAQQVGVAALPLPELTRRFDISMYRFRTTDLVQTGPDRPPFAAVRGDTVVDDAKVTRAGLMDVALGIAEHLADTMAPLDEPVGLMGTYRPVADRFDPLVAPPLEQALAAWSLARFSRLGGLDEMTAARTVAVSDQILGELHIVAEGETDPLDSAVACAAIVHAALEHPSRLDGQAGFFFEATRRVRSAFSEHGFTDTGDDRPIPPHSQALIAAALSRLLDRPNPPDRALVRAAIDAAWASVPKHQQVALLPWIGWAESDFARATGEPMMHVEDLRGIRELLDASRVGSAGRPGPPDLAGGFTLSQGRRLVATSQSLRPAAFLAWMARDRRLTADDEAALALGRMLKTARFVMQLSVRPESTWAYPNPALVSGGVRTSTWNCDQPVPAQALGLVTVTELLLSLDTLAAR